VSAGKGIISLAAIDRVVSTACVDSVVAGAAGDLVRASLPGDRIVSGAAIDQGITATAADNGVVSVTTINGCVAMTGGNDVISTVTVKCFVSANAGQDIVALGPDPIGVIILKIFRNQVVTIDVLQNDCVVAGQCDVGIGSDLGGDIQNFIKIAGNLNPGKFPAVAVQVDPVFCAVACREVPDRQGAEFIVPPTPKLESIISVAACDGINPALRENGIVFVGSNENVVVIAAINICHDDFLAPISI